MKLLFEIDFKDYNPNWKIVTRQSARARQVELRSYSNVRPFFVSVVSNAKMTQHLTANMPKWHNVN